MKRLLVNYIPVNFDEPLKKLTANVDVQFAEVPFGPPRKLYDEVSGGGNVAGTPQVDCRPGSDDTRVLTADGVVPQRRCHDCG